MLIAIDYFRAAISLGAAILGHLGRSIVALTPYLIILAAFGGFVLWNGSVVLGMSAFRPHIK